MFRAVDKWPFYLRFVGAEAFLIGYVRGLAQVFRGLQ